jgi:hypothetical protein
MESAVELLVVGSTLLYCELLTLASVLLQIFISCKTYLSFLKWLTLSFLAYGGTVFVVQIHWN